MHTDNNQVLRNRILESGEDIFSAIVRDGDPGGIIKRIDRPAALRRVA